ncbi:MAG: hypothetical protein ACI915_003593 [Gammaproteobacteria bacterium]|jgi:hypothetical protein
MSNTSKELLASLRQQHRELLERYNPDSCIESLDRVAESDSYHKIPDDVIATWLAVRSDFGRIGFEAFQKITLASLIDNFEIRSREHKYTDSVRQCYTKSYDRIIKSISDPDFSNYCEDNDALKKDLGLCRQKLFPAGAQVVEAGSSFHRAMMFRDGIKQALAMLSLLCRSGDNKNWYQIHTHLGELDDFNPDGWNKCYIRLADMMELDTNVRGIWGGSWFYDPILDTISPRLSYLREVPQNNGAFVLYSNIDLNGGALSKSESRKTAHDNGEYVPKSYAMIWLRKDILKWASTMRDAD